MQITYKLFHPIQPISTDFQKPVAYFCIRLHLMTSVPSEQTGTGRGRKEVAPILVELLSLN